MKIRTNFVSNSSSSSFVTNTTATTAEVAVAMVEAIDEEYRDSGRDGEGISGPYYEKARNWLQEHLGFNDPIVIPWSCNYDTWIIRIDGTLTIDTCWNHDWEEVEDQFALRYAHEDDSWEWKGATQDQTFFDLSTLEPVLRSGYKDLWERSHEG